MSTNRYSDNDLKEFKSIIDSKLKEAKEDLVLLKGSLSHKDDHGTDGRNGSTSRKTREVYQKP